MTQSNKITILDTDKTIFTEIEAKLNKWKLQGYTIEYYNKLSEIIHNKHLGVCVIDHRYFDGAEEEIKKIERISDRMILLVDDLNSPVSGHAYVRGLQVHFRDSPVNALLFKIANKTDIRLSKKNQQDSITSEQKNRVISFMSPTGGVGKSFLALNTALHLCNKGKNVLFIDFSVFNNTAITLKLKNDNKGLDNLVSELDRVDRQEQETNYQNLFSENIKKYKCKKGSMDVLYGDSPIKIEKLSADTIQTIFEGLTESDYDFIIVDTSSELSEKNLALAEISDDIVLCSSPDITSGWKLIKFKEILDHMQVSDKCKLVVNKYSKKVSFSCKQLEMELGIPLIGVLPFDLDIQYLSNCGLPIALQNSKTNTYLKYIANHFAPVFQQKEIKLKAIKV